MTRSLPLIAFFAVSLLSGCSRPAQLSECGDADCRRAVAVRQWTSDPQGVADQIAALPDPIEQIGLVETLVEAWPGQTSALCERLADGPARQRCERINIRPHLQGQTDLAAAAMMRTQANAPGNTLLLPTQPEAFASYPWTQTAPQVASCDASVSQHACQAEAASRAAAAGEVSRTVSLCAAIDGDQWRWECMFHASEIALTDRGAAGAGVAIDLCLATGDFLSNCLAHAAMGVGQLAPPADKGGARAWAPITAAATEIRERLTSRDPLLAERVVERTWAEAANRAYAQATNLTGDPADHLPEEARPHVRAAAVNRLVQQEGTIQRDLAQWANRVEEVLASRGAWGLPLDPQTGPPAPPKNFWQERYPGEEALPSVLYLGTAHRVLGPTPQDDRLICLLEAMARQPSTPASLFVDGVHHPTLEVAWTAARLIQALDDTGDWLQPAKSDPRPLVSARGVFLARGGAMGAAGSIGP